MGGGELGGKTDSGQRLCERKDRGMLRKGQRLRRGGQLGQKHKKPPDKRGRTKPPSLCLYFATFLSLFLPVELVGYKPSPV